MQFEVLVPLTFAAAAIALPAGIIGLPDILPLPTGIIPLPTPLPTGIIPLPTDILPIPTDILPIPTGTGIIPLPTGIIPPPTGIIPPPTDILPLPTGIIPPITLPPVASPGQCSTGPIQCCSSVQDAGSPVVSVLLALLGVVLNDVKIPIGLTCSPISVIGVPGNSCSGQPVCCENNSFNGIIAIGCTPVNLNI